MKNDTTPSITYEERVQACNALAKDLQAAGIRAEAWTSPAKGGNDAGTGVALYDDAGEQQANVTVDGKSILRVRLVLNTLPGTELARRFAKALKIPVESFIPDGKFTKSTEQFGGFRKYTKRAEA
jgi:hypothetical protein